MNRLDENIPGWFSFGKFYSQQVANAKDGARFLEMGCYLGKSTAYMAVEIANSGKQIRFTVVDDFSGEIPEQDPKKLRKTFERNLKPVENFYDLIADTSANALTMVADDSLDFCFIDGSHRYDAVVQDMGWWNKVKPGGILGGHDYCQWPEVKRVVDEYFGALKLHVFLDQHQDVWWVERPFGEKL